MTTAPVGFDRSGGTWLRVLAVARRHAYVLQRSPHRLFDVTIWPCVDVFMFGSIGVFVARSPGAGHTAFGYLLSGVVLWQVVYQSQISLSTGVLEETWSRNLLNMMVTPMREVDYVAGVALFGLVKLVMGVGLVALTLAVFYAFDVWTLGWGLIPVAVVLLGAGTIVSLFVIGLVLRFGTGAEALAWGVLFVLLPLSGVFYPISALPAILRPVAQILPTTHAFAAMRPLLRGEALDWGQLGLAAAAMVGMLAAAIAFVTRMLRTFRARGYITRFL